MGDPRDGDRLRLKLRKPIQGIPEEIRIDHQGNVYVNGELFEEEASQYPRLSVDVQKQSRLNTGEETQKILEKSKLAKRGERVTIKDVRGPEKSETTTVKF